MQLLVAKHVHVQQAEWNRINHNNTESAVVIAKVLYIYNATCGAACLVFPQEGLNPKTLYYIYYTYGHLCNTTS